MRNRKRADVVRLYEHAQQKPHSEVHDILTWEVKPYYDASWLTSHVFRWRTLCGRYRVTRATSKIGDKHRFVPEFRVIVPHSDGFHGMWDYLKMKPTKGQTPATADPDEYLFLMEAFSSVEKYHCKRYKLEGILSNKQEAVSKAERLGLSNLLDTYINYDASLLLEGGMATASGFKVTNTALAELLQDMGYSQADSWPDSKLAKYALSLKDLELTEDDLPQSKTSRLLLEELVAALSEGGVLEVVPMKKGSEAMATKEKDKKSKKAGKEEDKKSKKAHSNGKPEKAEKATEKEGKKKAVASDAKDRFGARLTAATGKINACLVGKAKTYEMISQESGQPIERVRGHLQYWHGRKEGLGQVLQKNDKGWFLAKSEK